MSRHEGVSCDSCLKSNFNGRRYKCLICYDYDLCADCYEEGATSTRHSVDHPMQCILTRSDIELYFGGEMLNSEQPQSFTCPYCKKMGFSDATLLEHVGSEHTDTGLEVVCPVCAGLPGGDPNLVTDDFAGHLTLEHRTGHRDLISFLDEPSAIRHGGVRRIPGRALGGPRSRRSNMHFSSTSGLSALSPSGRESVDPIAELLSQLSGVRRGAPQTSQLQQLQMQIQLERQQLSATRQQLERLPRRQAHPMVTSSNSNVPMQEVITGTGSGNIGGGIGNTGLISSTSSQSHQQQQPQSSMAVSSLNSRDGNAINLSQLTVTNLGLTSAGFQGIGISCTNNNGIIGSGGIGENQTQFLLAKFMSPSLNEIQLEQLEKDRADRSQYVQALMLSTLSSIKLDYENDDNQKRGESQETNSDNVNSETNNDSSDENTTNNSHRHNAKDDKNTKSSTFGGGGGGGGCGNVINNEQQPILVHQQQQTSPEDFLDEYTLQQQQQNYNTVCKKKQLPIAGKSNQSSQTSSTAGVEQQQRRGRPPPPPIGSAGVVVPSGQQNQVKLGREMKANTTASKEIPDSR